MLQRKLFYPKIGFFKIPRDRTAEEYKLHREAMLSCYEIHENSLNTLVKDICTQDATFTNLFFLKRILDGSFRNYLNSGWEVELYWGLVGLNYPVTKDSVKNYSHSTTPRLFEPPPNPHQETLLLKFAVAIFTYTLIFRTFKLSMVQETALAVVSTGILYFILKLERKNFQDWHKIPDDHFQEIIDKIISAYTQFYKTSGYKIPDPEENPCLTLLKASLQQNTFYYSNTRQLKTPDGTHVNLEQYLVSYAKSHETKFQNELVPIEAIKTFILDATKDIPIEINTQDQKLTL